MISISILGAILLAFQPNPPQAVGQAPDTTRQTDVFRELNNAIASA